MSVGPDPLPRSPGGFVHPLLRARDWQDRPEFGELCQWWKDGGVGVCALVGIGGAGKTAIAERFLQVLPGGYPEHPKVPKDRNLAAPARLFVFSFYDAPNPDAFFNELAAWLQDLPAGDRTQILSYHQVLERLAVAGRCLLTLDGLEKVQDDGVRGGAFGQILDGRLRDFVLRIADGWLPHVSVVITSRFRLYDPLANRTWYYCQIGVEQLQPLAAVQLLRDRGVRGMHEELEYLAREQGYHALSVDLVGGYVARFYGGNPLRFSFFSPEADETSDLLLDPRLAALQDQERKLSRLTERYHQALAKSDPAALALLQRICLFRLGVDAKTLISVFIGAEKEKISGPALASLNKQGLQRKLQLLVEMRLIEISRSQPAAQRSSIYTVHPAVRDGFLKTLESEAARLGHKVAREGLEASLGGHPGGNPADPATLDLLEEIVHHSLAAGNVQEAWNIYEHRIGGYENLGWRLGAYERGERICRAFTFGQSIQTVPVPTGLSENDQVRFVNEWALYLESLGQLVASSRRHEWVVERSMQRENWKYACVGSLNLAYVLLVSGYLTASLEAAEEGLEFAHSTYLKCFLHAHCGFVRALRGSNDAAIADFAQALQRQLEFEGSSALSLWSRRGTHHERFLALLGRLGNAAEFAASNKTKLLVRDGADDNEVPLCNLILADLAREQGDLPSARELLHQAHEWALQRDAKEPLCWSALVHARIELSTLSDERFVNRKDARASLPGAASAIEDGLRIARECGYGIYHIDLLLVRAQLALHEGRAPDAERDARVALEEGVHPPEESGYPELLAATDPECLYAWGIAEGRHLLGEALLLQAAQKHGQAEFVPKRLDHLPSDVRDLIDRARDHLEQAMELWRELRDPQSDAEINPRGERTRHVLEGLAGGVLTEYPLVPDTPAPTSTPEPTSKESSIPMSSIPSVFVCYARADNRPPKQWLDRLLEHLSSLVRQQDLAVCSDQDLKIGDEWNPEIQRNLAAAKVAVLLVSPAFLASKYIASSEVPVLLKRASEGGLKILPVLLSPSLVHRTRFKWPDPEKGPEHFTLTSLQAAGSPSETLSEMTEPEQDRVFVALVERILEIVGGNP